MAAAKRAAAYARGEFKMGPKVPFGKPRTFTARKLAVAAKHGLPQVDYDHSLAMAVRLIDGGRPAFIRYVTLAAEAGDDNAKRFRTVWDELGPYNQSKQGIDGICVKAGLDRGALLGTIVRTAFEHSVDVGNLVAAAAHPSIIEGTVRSAKRLNSSIGQRDRMALLAHAGFLPTPKGATINIVANANAVATNNAANSPSVPSFLDDMNQASAARDQVQAAVIEGQVVAPDDADEVGIV